MFDPNSKRFAGMAAIAFVIIWLVAFLAFVPSGLPDSGDSGAKVMSYVSDHRGALLTSVFLQGLAAIPFLMFTAGIVTMMRRAEGDRMAWSLMAALGAAVAGGAVLVGGALWAMVTYRGGAGDPGLARTLFDGSAITYAIAGFPLAVFLIGASQGLVASGLAGRWMAPMGMLVAIVEVVGAAAYAKGDGFFSPQGAYSYIAVLAFLAWSLAAGVSLMREHAPVAAAHPPATPAAA